MIKIGIIGYGKMGQIRASAVEATGRARVLFVCDPVDEVELPSGSEAASIADIFGNDDLDAVFVCTPNYLNKTLTIQALESGKHVFCEKPPAFDAGEVEEIIEIERATGLKLMYGFNHRHHESVQRIKSLVDSGRSGKILWMRGRYGKSVDEGFYDNWRSKKKLSGGGILIDQGIHMLDLFLYLAGDFDEVKAFVSNLYWRLDVEDNVFAIMRNSATNVAASLHSTMTQWRHLFSLEIFCEQGYYVLNGLRTTSQTYGDETLSIATARSAAPAARSEDEEQIFYRVDNSWRSEVDQFLDGIENDVPIQIGNSGDALKLMRLIDSIYAQQ